MSIKVTALVLIVTLFGATSAVSSSFSTAYRAEIPFAFTVQNTSFEPGVFEVRSLNPTTLLLKRANRGDAAISITHRGDLRSPRSDAALLIFHVYGNEHFLGKVVLPTDSHILPKSKSEKAASSRALTQTELSIRLAN